MAGLDPTKWGWGWVHGEGEQWEDPEAEGFPGGAAPWAGSLIGERQALTYMEQSSRSQWG